MDAGGEQQLSAWQAVGRRRARRSAGDLFILINLGRRRTKDRIIGNRSCNAVYIQLCQEVADVWDQCVPGPICQNVQSMYIVH